MTEILAYMPAYMFSVTVFSISNFIPSKPQLDGDEKSYVLIIGISFISYAYVKESICAMLQLTM